MNKRILELIEKRRELKPVSRIAGNMIGRKQSDSNSGNLSAMFVQPISLENAIRRRRRRRRIGGKFVFGNDGDLVEIRQCESVDRRFLGMEVSGDGRMKVGATYQSYQWHRWCSEFFRVLLHFYLSKIWELGNLRIWGLGF